MLVLGEHVYSKEAFRHCNNAKSGLYFNFKDAKRACNTDENCVAIWQPNCKGQTFRTCGRQRNWEEIEITSNPNPSCLFHKNTNH